MGSTKAPWFCTMCCQKGASTEKERVEGRGSRCVPGGRNTGLFLGTACSSCSSWGWDCPVGSGSGCLGPLFQLNCHSQRLQRQVAKPALKHPPCQSEAKAMELLLLQF